MSGNLDDQDPIVTFAPSSGVLDKPETVFTFTTSKDEALSVTQSEMGDLVAFVRELKAKADKGAARYTCPKCGGKWDGDVYTSRPIQHRCTSCNQYWTP